MGCDGASPALGLRPFTADDLPLFRRWLETPHVARWYHHPEAWLAELRGQDGEYRWLHHYIALAGGAPVGFGQYYALGDSDESWPAGLDTAGAYSLDYLIGEPGALGRGYGRAIAQGLVSLIRRRPDARRVLVWPEAENAASRALLRSCGFAPWGPAGEIFVKELR